MKRLALIVSLALACRHSPAPVSDVRGEPASVTRAEPPPRARPDAAAPSALERRLSSLADQLIDRLTSLRGLAPRGPIARGVMTRDAVVARIRERTRQEYPPGEVELEGALLKRLGMIPEALDYERTIYDLLEEQVLGFYDPDARRLYIADWVPLEAQPVTMAHELTHALQDQHFDIGRHIHHRQGGGDRQAAAMAVIEGDATATMVDFSLAPLNQRVTDLPDAVERISAQLRANDQPRLNAAPLAMRESLLFPYLAGFGMCVRALREGGGYRAVDALLARMPDSTEQVLHPEKLRSREPPIEVPATLPEVLGRGHRVAYHDVMGELGLRLHLQPVVGEQVARDAAAGWGGDHALLVAPTAEFNAGDAGARLSRGALDHTAALWVIVMDSDEDAAALLRALGAVLGRRYVEASRLALPGAAAARVVDARSVAAVASRGRRVVVIDRMPRAIAAEVIAASLRAER